METWDALRARRNVRQFTDQPVPDEALDRILEAGRRAPSASNWQPWDFVLVTDRAQLVELAKVWQFAKHVAAAAAAIAIVAPEPEDDRQSALLQYDLGQATYAMTVAAADLGVGTGHAAAADQDQARDVLGFPRGTVPGLRPRRRLPLGQAVGRHREVEPTPLRRGRAPRTVVTVSRGRSADPTEPADIKPCGGPSRESARLGLPRWRSSMTVARRQVPARRVPEPSRCSM